MESQFSISGFAAAEHYGAKPAYDDKAEQQDEQHIGRLRESQRKRGPQFGAVLDHTVIV